MSYMTNVKNQMSNVNKVKLLSERTSEVPPVISEQKILLESFDEQQILLESNGCPI